MGINRDRTGITRERVTGDDRLRSTVAIDTIRRVILYCVVGDGGTRTRTIYAVHCVLYYTAVQDTTAIIRVIIEIYPRPTF